MIEYNKPITREEIDYIKFENKFVTVDDYKLKPTDNLTDDDKILYSQLMKDPTTFSYMNFQVDGKPLRLYPYQDSIINDNHRYKIFRAANQIGKSLLLDIKAAYNLIWDHGHSHNEAIVSKSLPQSTFQMRRVKSLLYTAKFFDWKDNKGDSDSMSVISYDVKDDNGKIKYTNLCICVPPTESLLGYDIHELNLDEFEYWDVDIKYFFNQIAQPRTYTTKGNITIFSNPNGQDNFVADLEVQTLKDSNVKKWHTYIFNFLDKPGNTQEEYDQLKHELSRQEFESTVAAIRSLSDRNYFSPDEIERSYDKELNNRKEIAMIGKQPFFFLDVGAKHDQSCLIGGYVEPQEDEFVHVYIPIIHLYPIGYPLTRVCGVDVDESDGWHMEKSVDHYLKEYGKGGINPIFGFDVTGNEGMRALFEKMNIVASDINFSGPNKSGYYQRYKYHMEKGLLHRIKHKDWERQAGRLIVTKGARGYLLINSGLSGTKEATRMKKIPDDTQDSTAGFIYLANPSDKVPVTLKVI